MPRKKAEDTAPAILVTEVRLFFPKSTRNPRFMANATVVLNDAVAIHGLSVLDGRDGLFVVFPDRKDRHGKFVDITHPINSDARKVIVDAVLAQYEAEKAGNVEEETE